MIRFFVARRRLFLALALMPAVFLLLPATLRATTRELLAWDTGLTAYLAASMLLFSTEPATTLPRHAARQQEGEWTIFFVILGVLLASFSALFGEFSVTKSLHGAAKLSNVTLIAATLLLSWLMLQVTFCYRYAHEFYETTPSGQPAAGLLFPGETTPDYLDFLYFALVLGMTFQVSDVQITTKTHRRLATLHGLLSFLFNTVILALSINIGASLMG